jgi:hypothetical protein
MPATPSYVTCWERPWLAYTPCKMSTLVSVWWSTWQQALYLLHITQVGCSVELLRLTFITSILPLVFRFLELRLLKSLSNPFSYLFLSSSGFFSFGTDVVNSRGSNLGPDALNGWYAVRIPYLARHRHHHDLYYELWCTMLQTLLIKLMT